MTNLQPLILFGLVTFGAIAGTALVDFVRLMLLERFHRAEIDRLLYVPD